MDNTNTNEPKSKLDYIIPPIILICLGLNIYSIHKVDLTVVSTLFYFKTVLIGALVLSPVIIYLALAAFKDKFILIRILIGYGSACVLYFIFFSAIPFFINTFDSSTAEYYNISSYSVSQESIYDDDDQFSHYAYDYDFTFDGCDFSKSSSDAEANGIEIKTKKGIFGWKYIDKIYLK